MKKKAKRKHWKPPLAGKLRGIRSKNIMPNPKMPTKLTLKQRVARLELDKLNRIIDIEQETLARTTSPVVMVAVGGKLEKLYREADKLSEEVGL